MAGNNGFNVSAVEDVIPPYLEAALEKRRESREDPALQQRGVAPNYGQYAIPHLLTYQSLHGTFSRAYKPADEALKHSYENARFMRNDTGVMECVEARQRSTALLDWHLEPEDENSLEQKELCAELTKIIERIPRFTEYRNNLLHAVWYGKYAVQNRYSWQNVGGRMRVMPTPHREDNGWIPVNGDKLVFRYDDGERRPDRPPFQLGIRVGHRKQIGDKINQRWEVEPTGRGLAYFIPDYERSAFIVHKHMIEDGAYEDNWSGEQLHGVGIRSRIYWDWFQKQESLAFLMEYLERSAGGIEIWTYPAGDAGALTKAKESAKERLSNSKNVIFFPKPMGDDGNMYDIQVIEPGMAGIESLKDILQTYYGHRIKRYILGQVLSTEAEATGLGSGVAELHFNTFLQIVRYDAVNLEETLTRELVRNLKNWNFPKAAGIDVRFKIETESPDVEKRLEAYHMAYQMGARLRESDVIEMIGAGIPDDDDKVLQDPNIAQAQQQSQMGGGMPGMPQPGGMGPNQRPQGPPTSVGFSGEKQMADDVVRELWGDDNPKGGSVTYVDEGGTWQEREVPEFDTGDRSREGDVERFSRWDESKHGRDKDGKFAHGSGGSRGVDEAVALFSDVETYHPVSDWVAEQLSEHSFTPDEVEGALREAASRGVDPTMSDDLYSLGEYLQTFDDDPDQYRKSDDGSRWITVSGTHVQVDGDGRILKGPKHFKGKTVAEATAGSEGGAAAKKTSSKRVEQAAANYRKLRTKSPEFKAWFGDWENKPAEASKVIDQETGEPALTSKSSQVIDERTGAPIPVYHGTQAERFDAFDRLHDHGANLFGPGFYFTQDEQIAAGEWKTHERVAELFEDRGLAEEEAESLRSNGRDATLQEMIDPRSGKEVVAVISEGGKRLASPGYAQKDLQLTREQAEQLLSSLRGAGHRVGLTGDKLHRLEEAARAEDGMVSVDKMLSVMPADAQSAAWSELERMIPDKLPGNVFNAFLNIRQPFHLSHAASKDDLERIRKAATSIQGNAAEFSKRVNEWRSQFKAWDAPSVSAGSIKSGMDAIADELKYFEGSDDPHHFSQDRPSNLHVYDKVRMALGIPGPLGKAAANELLKDAGFDGMSHTGGHFRGGPAGRKHRVWIAFEPSQIKSVQNRGTFDASDNRMDYERQRLPREVQQFARLVRDAEQAGVTAIDCPATVDGQDIGHSIYARLGADARIDVYSLHRSGGAIPDAVTRAQTVRELMQSAEGRRWWDQNGTGVSLRFSTRADSYSRQSLAAFCEWVGDA